MKVKKNRIRTDLRIFLTVVIALIVIGALFIYAASSVYSLARYGSPAYYLKRHLFGLLLGMCAAWLLKLFPIRRIEQLSTIAFLGALTLTLLTIVSPFALRIHGSRRWLSLAGFTFQPSELLKISFIVYLASFLSKKQHRITSLSSTYLPFILMVSITSCLLLLQPDFGLAVTLLCTAFMLMFSAGAKLRHLVITASACIPMLIALVIFKPYRLKRVLTFLHPWSDPQGKGFQIIQSLIAIGSGGSFGVGIAHSKQKFFYLPMQHTDFIFSIIAEETGFFGSCMVIMLFALFLYFGIRLACSVRNQFSSYTILGLVLLISLQALINIAVAVGLVPTKGIGLPFISYGNTALVTHLCMIGLIANLVQRDPNY
jgi:cell division protein FtsW